MEGCAGIKTGNFRNTKKTVSPAGRSP